MTNLGNTSPFSKNDFEALREAVRVLENPGFFIRVVDIVGKPVDLLLRRLPSGAEEVVRKAVGVALERGLDVALYGMEGGWGLFRQEKIMKVLVAGTGAVGGAFGLGALPAELPVSTCMMLRSIAEIARAEGEDLRSSEGRLACLEVFAFGGKGGSEQDADAGYYTVRAGLGQEVRAALQYLGKEQADRAAAPFIVRFIERIAQRFGIQVSEKAAAQAVPVIGALGGATINALFMDHFQDVAHAHFTVRRLERTYGEDTVREQYSRFANEGHR